jgi:hypothetical protein
MLLTAFSWFILGIRYGWGYCFCTDWHWRAREKLGYHDRSHSYIHFLVLKITGINFDPDMVEHVTLFVFLASFALSVWLNLRGCKKKKLGM